MLVDGGSAAEEIGLDVGPLKLVVVENTPAVHNVIVCTLCSCYPRMLLGLPPDWYKSRVYRSRVVREPRAVLAEFGTMIPDDVLIRVHDSTADMRYLVAAAPGRNRKLERGGACAVGDARQHDRRQPAAASRSGADRKSPPFSQEPRHEALSCNILRL